MEFWRQVPPDQAAVPTVRHEFRAWLTEQADVHGESLDDILLVASELLTNGLLHAAAEPITLRAGFQEGQFLVEVMSIDRPPAAPTAPNPSLDPLRETGRGLQIVAALSDEHSTTITGRMRVASCWISRGRLAGGTYR